MPYTGRQIITGLGSLPVTATMGTTARTLSDRFSDVVNVKDFGAKGDGATDDTATVPLVVPSYLVMRGGGKVNWGLPRTVIKAAATFAGQAVIDISRDVDVTTGYGATLEDFAIRNGRRGSAPLRASSPRQSGHSTCGKTVALEPRSMSKKSEPGTPAGPRSSRPYNV